MEMSVKTGPHSEGCRSHARPLAGSVFVENQAGTVCENKMVMPILRLHMCTNLQIQDPGLLKLTPGTFFSGAAFLVEVQVHSGMSFD